MEFLMEKEKINTGKFNHAEAQRTRRISRYFSGILLLSIFLAGCTTMVQKGGEVIEGSAFAEKTTAVYRSVPAGKGTRIELRELISREGETSIEITNSAWPGLAFRGNYPDNSGNFELTSARILSSHVQGWNEFSLDLLGNAAFSGSNLRINEAERIQISSGKIRLKSNYLTGPTALTTLRNRRERILALTEWMIEKLQNDYSVVINNQREFENYWKPILFPELMSKKKVPSDYTTENAKWRRADSVKWNLSYTQRLFPEGLREYRNSGAMLRDWEEALPWIYIEYSWDTAVNSFNINSLQKTK